MTQNVRDALVAGIVFNAIVVLLLALYLGMFRRQGARGKDPGGVH